MIIIIGGTIDRAVIYLIRVHSAFVELPQEAFRQVPLRGS
jgi:hypothetical protein